MKYAEWQQTEFYGFFGIHETGRSSTPDRRTQIDLKPGGFQESIDLQVETLSTDEVANASLQVDRSWLITPGGTNTLGVDIVKSFIDANLTKASQAAGKPLVQTIWGLSDAERTLQIFQHNAAALEPGLVETLPGRLPGPAMRMIVRQEAPQPLPTLQPEILHILLVFFGIRDKATLSVPSWSLTASNQHLNGKTRFCVSVDYQS